MKKQTPLLTIDAVEIPEAHGQFAKAIAALADNYGMDSFTMTYRPNFENRLGYDVSGDLKIYYSSVDGRGRPERTLKIECDTKTTSSIISERGVYSQ
jgi:hypothetical protein